MPALFGGDHSLSEVVRLLVQYRTVLDEDSTCLAHAIATSCLGGDELWCDMNFSSSVVLDDIFHGFFTVLAARNREGLPWKLFLERELNERRGQRFRGARDAVVER